VFLLELRERSDQHQAIIEKDYPSHVKKLHTVLQTTRQTKEKDAHSFDMMF
jgi:hypothetical protein